MTGDGSELGAVAPWRCLLWQYASHAMLHERPRPIGLAVRVPSRRRRPAANLQRASRPFDPSSYAALPLRRAGKPAARTHGRRGGRRRAWR